ncbi:MAG TPA: SIS domain-containing protein [Gemmataceae bacterium]|nr:SIS domain-containing protein [Gemmataceae bacterium]
MANEPRTQHPFHMYEHILAEPDGFARSVQRNNEVVGAFAAPSQGWRQLLLIGIGTSYHAAQVGEHLVRANSPGLPVRAWHSFDFVHYGPDLSPEDCVVAISHRGTKRYTAQALRRARQAGCRVALVTGEGQPAAAADADAVFQTVAQERSSAHTVSYVGAVAVLGLMATRVAACRGAENPAAEELLHGTVPAALREATRTEDEVRNWAGAHARKRRIWLVGAGPSAVTAQEVALKIKETSYLQAEGTAVETLLHGPLQCVEQDDVFVLIIPDGKAQDRLIELGKMVQEIGSPYVVVSDGTPQELRPAAAGWCVVPRVPEEWSTLTCLVPLQLFAYYLALGRGTNPDGFRLDDPRFARAHKLVQF